MINEFGPVCYLPVRVSFQKRFKEVNILKAYLKIHLWMRKQTPFEKPSHVYSG